MEFPRIFASHRGSNDQSKKLKGSCNNKDSIENTPLFLFEQIGNLNEQQTCVSTQEAIP